MVKHTFRSVLIAALIFISLAGTQTWAQESKPFAEYRLVLQLSDAGEERETRVLNVVSNLVRYYGPDQIDIEVVVFGQAMPMLYADSDNKDRIAALMHNGIRFSACDNTLDTLKRKNGSVPALLPQIYHVTAGVARMMELVKQGYILVKP